MASNGSFRIERGVEIPDPNRTFGHNGYAYPWAEMRVGDSFTVHYRKSSSAAASGCAYLHKNGLMETHRVVTRRIRGTDQTRVWFTTR